MAMLIEQAGGAATDGRRRILDIGRQRLHERVPLVFGSAARSSRDRPRYHERSEPLFDAALAAVRPARPDAVSWSERQTCRAGIPSSRSPAPRAPARPRSSGPSSRSSAARTSGRPIIEGDAFHRFDRATCDADGRGGRTRQPALRHFAPGPTCSELEAVFRATAETGTGTTRHYVHDDEEAAAYGMPPGTFTGWDAFPPDPTCCSTKACMAASSTDRSTSRARRPEDRRRAGDQPRMDPEDPPRPRVPRLFHRGRDRHDPAAHAGLRADYICPQFAEHRHQLPARADGRHLEPVHRALDPDARRIDGGDPLRRIRAASISRICCR